MAYLINTSVDDMRSSLKCSESRYTIRQLRSDLEDEKNLPGHKRSTVILLLVAAIRKKLKKAATKRKRWVCEICLCTQNHACPDPQTGTCYWVKDSLCSACATPNQKKKIRMPLKQIDLFDAD